VMLTVETTHYTPLTKEITLQIFGLRDLSVFPTDLLSERDSSYSTENLFGFLGDSP